MIKVKQLRDAKGHFLSVEATKQAIAKNFVEVLKNRWKGQSYQSTARYGSFQNFARQQYMVRKGDFAVINMEAFKAALRGQNP